MLISTFFLKVIILWKLGEAALLRWSSVSNNSYLVASNESETSSAPPTKNMFKGPTDEDGFVNCGIEEEMDFNDLNEVLGTFSKLDVKDSFAEEKSESVSGSGLTGSKKRKDVNRVKGDYTYTVPWN